MTSHPKGIVIDIVGIKICDHGHSCKEDEICGFVLRNNMVISMQKVMIVNAYVLIMIA